jgi:DNA replication protein DnaC
VEWKRLLAKLQQTKYKEAEQDALIREMQSVDVLYLDDFLKTAGNAKPSDEALNYALEIINARYIRDKKTIISTEFMDKELIGFDEALGSRIVEKSFQIQVLRSQGRNFRTK